MDGTEIKEVSLHPAMLCYCVLLEPKRKPVIWPWEGEQVSSGPWKLTI